MHTSRLTWGFALAAWIAGYELLRAGVLRIVGGRLRGGALRFVRQHKVRLDHARFIDRLWLREALLRDPEVEAAVADAAAARGLPAADLWASVADWVQEIVPAFSLATYYRLGVPVARAAVELCFELVFDRERFARMRARVPEGAVVITVMNHRSNADYIVLSYGLLRDAALSYAVGEWARVWPLDVLFRAFGSFFVRRGEQDRLYHKVLERYVQILLEHGGTTGFFIEGRLSRTGALGEAKAGLLDFIVGLRRAHPALEIAFLPIGVNFDRVLEDSSLVRERKDAAPPGVIEKLASFLQFIGRLPVLVSANALKVALRAHRKFGYAAVAAGEPVLYSAWEAKNLAADPPPEGHTGGVPTLGFEARRSRIKALAADLLAAVGAVVPAPPVPILCAALLSCAEGSDGVVTARVREIVAALREAGAPLALGRAFTAPREAESAMAELEAELSAGEEAAQIVTVAGYALARRGLVRHTAAGFEVVRENADLVRYYAASIAQHL